MSLNLSDSPVKCIETAERIETVFRMALRCTGLENAGEVGRNCFFRPVDQEVSGSDALPPKICTHRDGNPRSRRCAGGGIRSIINNTGGSRSWLITGMVQLTSTRLVVWKSVDDTHSWLRRKWHEASHARCATVEPTATMRIQNYAGRWIKMAVAESAPQADIGRSLCAVCIG